MSDSDKEKNNNSDNSKDDDGDACLWCGSTPCEWLTYGGDIKEGAHQMYGDGVSVNDNQNRKAMLPEIRAPTKR